MNVLWTAERETSPEGSLCTVFVPGRRGGTKCLVGEHKLIIRLPGAGQRPGGARRPENGVLCFGSFLKQLHSLCGGVNVLIAVVIGTHGGLVWRAGNNDCVAHFFRTTAILIFLPSTKKKEIKDPASIRFELSPSALLFSSLLKILHFRCPKPMLQALMS